MLVILGVVWVSPDMNWLCQLVALTLAGSVAGFLPFNFPKAKMFLGDVGSITLGFSSSVLILWIWTDNPTGPNRLLLPVFVLYFFLEGMIALLRRMLAGKKWWEPHKEHFYQRMVSCRYSHARTTSLIICIQCFVTVLVWSASLSVWSPELSWVLSILLWAGFFVYVDIKFRNIKKNQSIEL